MIYILAELTRVNKALNNITFFREIFLISKPNLKCLGDPRRMQPND